MRSHATDMYSIKSVESWLLEKKQLPKQVYIKEYPVHHAAKTGNLFEIRKLVHNMRYNYNYVDYNGNSPLMLACEAGKIDIVKFLLDLNVKVHTVNYAGNDALLIACLENRVEIVKILLDSDNPFYLNSTYEDGKTILHLVAEVGDYPTLGMVGEEIGDCDKLDSQGNTPLIIAAGLGHIGQVKDLLDCQANVNFQNPLNGFTALFVACEGNHLDVVEYLLTHGSDPYITNSYGEIPFFIASRMGNIEVAKMLVRKNGGLK